MTSFGNPDGPQGHPQGRPRGRKDGAKPVKRLLAHFVRDERAATAIEYGLIAGFISVAIFSAVVALSDSVDSLHSGVSSKVTSAVSSSLP